MLIRTDVDQERAKSILRMVEQTLLMVSEIDFKQFSSNVSKEYYEIIRELMSVVLLLDGFKTIGDGAHKEIIEYVSKNYSQFSSQEMELIDELRITRNKIAYEGFFVNSDYLNRNISLIKEIIEKFKILVQEKMN